MLNLTPKTPKATLDYMLDLLSLDQAEDCFRKNFSA